MLDQATKLAAVRWLPGQGVDLVWGAVTLRLSRNAGAAFGLLANAGVVVALAALAVTLVVIWSVRRVPGRGYAVALGLLLGGSLGNLTDRLVRSPGLLRGRVVDFVDFHVWPVFNMADIGIVVGAGLVLLFSWRQERRGRE